MIKIDISKFTTRGLTKMDNELNMPIKFQMALAHDKRALCAFMNMQENEQNEIINKASKIETIRELNIFTSNIGKRC